MGNKILISIVVVGLAYMANNHFNKPLIKSPVVEISTGKLQGKVSVSRDGRSYYEFMGIPFAKPPVKELRYEPPEPLTQKWKGVREAVSSSACIQIDLFTKQATGVEDCLFVNVASPRLDSWYKLPVLVFFHGGLFNFGTGHLYRPEYLVDEDVVVVTVNYRLASFGFLNTDDGIIRGNQGLKDQNLALKWIRDNIANFGGNPNDVTIFGESAGGASVHYQMLSPMSAGLFHKAIAQSGLTTMPWSFYPNPKEQAKRFAEKANCPTTTTKEMIKCLRNKDANELVDIHQEVNDQLRPMSAVFLPTIEKNIEDGKSFLTDRPLNIIASGKFTKVPFIAGINSGEGSLVSGPAVANKTIFKGLKENWSGTLPNLAMMTEGIDKKVLENIRSFYQLNDLNVEDPEKRLKNFTNLFSDWVWNLGFHNGMTAHSKHLSGPNSPPIYIYYYDYNGDFNLGDFLLALRGDYHPIIEILCMKATNWFKGLTGQPVEFKGSAHGDELAMEFLVTGLTNVAKDSKDYKFSKEFIKLIVQFIKSESKSLEFLGQKWEPQEPNKPLKYMNLDLTPKMTSEPFKERIDFWLPLNILK